MPASLYALGYGTISELALYASSYAEINAPADDNATRLLNIARVYYDVSDYVSCTDICHTVFEQRDIMPATTAATYLLQGSMRPGFRLRHLRSAVEVHEEMASAGFTRNEDLEELLRVTKGLDRQAVMEWCSSDLRIWESQQTHQMWLTHEFGER